MKIIIPEKINVIPDKYYYELKKLGDVVFYNDYPYDPTEINKRIKDAEILIVKWIYLPDDFLDYCPKLKYIMSLTSGFGHFPLEKARKRRVIIINSPTHNSLAVAEHTIALMFAVSKKIVFARDNIMKGDWKKSPYDFLGNELSGKTLLQIGYGNIGSKVAKIAHGIGMRVVVADSNTTDSQLDELIPAADYISINVPLTPRTKGMINNKRISLMKKTAYLFNTARGDIVDQNALYLALKNNKIAGAGLDVFVGTLPNERANKDVVKLAKLSNVVATPHMAFNTIEAGERMGKEMIDNVKAILKSKPINVVN